MWTSVFILLVSASATVYLEQQADEMMLSVEAGQLVSAADICGFKLDAEALKAFMSGKIADLHDTARFNYYAVTTNFPSELEAMTETAKLASCALQETLAKKHGLVK
ncbi:hypothetical protein [Shinella sp. JR1-6]|uniref:hypothetical protein n=1 Tax=Shinella sp. JR1-6 TaxID=2527671 RepID=UPI00102D5737|nr:hypothetical protein [Shinella sp. JR1-6]TAA61869.1 hypothetical protein EXZ48_12150 [Shinella sp. JR1-6]